jgi:hypothetical protein
LRRDEMKKLLILFSAILLIICFAVYANENTEAKNPRSTNMKIRILIDDVVLTATIYDNPTARDFIALLPLTLKLEDYAGTEKISQIPRKLSLKDAPSGADPSAGDITYYAPWGNLAIFYKDFQYSSGLIILGKIDSGANIFEKWKDSKIAKIERINVDK